MPIATSVPQDLLVRPYIADDKAAVLALMDADRITGQPRATPKMLDRALLGPPVDADRREDLEPPRTDVATTPGGQVVGAVSCTIRPADGAGLVLWLHCREDATAAETLIAHVLTVLGSRPLSAFGFASTLGLGLKGLPVRHRPATRRALTATGFSDRSPWRYLHRPLGAAVRCGYPLAEVEPCAQPPGWRLSLRETSGDLVGKATIGCPVDGIGVVWQISVEPPHRGRGAGRAVLAQCLAELWDKGAREVITYVGADVLPTKAPPPPWTGDPEHDHAAADRLFGTSGFTEVDVLRSFTRCP